jgi:hypothetical protein
MAIATLPTTLLEGTTGLYSFTLVDAAGAGIDGGFLTTLTLTYYDVASQTIVNGRDTQDVLNSNDVSVVTVPGPPLVTTVLWELQPADTVIVYPGAAQEWRVVQFRWTWDSGTRAGAFVAQFPVQNLLFVP